MKSEKSTYITVKDHSVSGEQFDLVYSQHDGILKTNPQPQANDLSRYYESDDYISHTNTKRNLFEKTYHFIRTIALRKKLKFINSFQTDTKKLLDVGCGTGDFLELAQKHNWLISGIEPNQAARKIANLKTNHTIYDTDELNKFEPDSYDVITLWHVLEHLPNPEEYLKIFNRLLKPDGYLVIAVPNYNSYDAQYYKSFWAAYDVPRHLWHFSQNGIKQLLQNFDFVFKKKAPMVFDAYYVSLLSEKYKRGFMNPLLAFCVGLWSNMKAKGSGEYSSLIYTFKNNENVK